MDWHAVQREGLGMVYSVGYERKGKGGRQREKQRRVGGEERREPRQQPPLPREERQGRESPRSLGIIGTAGLSLPMLGVLVSSA